MRLEMRQSITFSARWPWLRRRTAFANRMLSQRGRGAFHGGGAFTNLIFAPGAMLVGRAPRAFPRYRRPALLAAMTIAAGAMLRYLFDPVKGLNRRQQVAGAARHTTRRLRHRLGAGTADLGNRTRGFMVELWPVHAEVPDDVVLESRVKAELGHAVHHPDVDVSAHHGHVVLSGHAAVTEAEKLLRRTRKVRGVTDVESRIETTLT